MAAKNIASRGRFVANTRNLSRKLHRSFFCKLRYFYKGIAKPWRICNCGNKSCEFDKPINWNLCRILFFEYSFHFWRFMCHVLTSPAHGGARGNATSCNEEEFPTFALIIFWIYLSLLRSVAYYPVIPSGIDLFLATIVATLLLPEARQFSCSMGRNHCLYIAF